MGAFLLQLRIESRLSVTIKIKGSKLTRFFAMLAENSALKREHKRLSISVRIARLEEIFN